MSIYLGNQQVGVAVPNEVEPIGLEEIGMHTFASGDVIYEGTRLFPSAFERMPITSISAPNLTAFTDAAVHTTSGIGSYVFAYCSNLVNVDLPNLIRTGSGGYQ